MWSVRGRAGESDFPIASGQEERIPAAGESAQDVWDALYGIAAQRAQESASASTPGDKSEGGGSFFSRLFRRG
jgi:hypothetical protein